MDDMVFYIMAVAIPCILCVVVVLVCWGRLERRKKTFNYALVDCLAATVALVPTPAMIIWFGYHRYGLAAGFGLVFTQVAALIFAKTRCILGDKERSASFMLIVLFGLAAILVYAIDIFVTIVAILLIFGVQK